MHWSRVVDVPLGLLVRLFGLFTAPDNAERLARLVFPLALQGGLIAAIAWVARMLAGPAACLPAAFLLLLSGMTFGQFQPGRIDHHAPQILLLMAMTGTTLLALEARHARMAALTGVLIAVSLAISLENLPFMAVILVVPALAWAMRGERARGAALYFALGLGIAATAMFLATVPPARYAEPLCDAFSIAHLSGILGGAVGLAALCAFKPARNSATLRWMGLTVLGVSVAAGMVFVFPACLQGPYGGMDPLMRSLWLTHVTEAQPIYVATRLRPDTLTLLVLPTLASALAIVVALVRSEGLARARWLVVAALVAMGFAGTFWEVRVAPSVQPLALLGGAWAVAWSIRFGQRRSNVAWAGLPFGLVLAFSSLAWAFVPAGAMSDQTRAELAGGASCREASALAPLAGLAPGLVFAPIDAGSHLLAHTPLLVLGAPYHRNQTGNAAALRGFLAEPADAEAIVKGSQARYLALCPGEVQVQVMARAAPQGLAAQLVAGQVPPWLKPIPLPDTPYRVYAVE